MIEQKEQDKLTVNTEFDIRKKNSFVSALSEISGHLEQRSF